MPRTSEQLWRGRVRRKERTESSFARCTRCGNAPLGCVEDPDRKPLAHWIAGEVGLPLVPDVGYLTPGSFGTWSVEQGINIITWELPPEPIPGLLASHAPVLRRLLMGDYPRDGA